MDIDLTQPLRCFVIITRGDGKEDIWGRLRYERLPFFCYNCGKIGHGEYECDVEEEGGVVDRVKQCVKGEGRSSSNMHSKEQTSSFHARNHQTNSTTGARRKLVLKSAEVRVDLSSLVDVPIAVDVRMLQGKGKRFRRLIPRGETNFVPSENQIKLDRKKFSADHTLTEVLAMMIWIYNHMRQRLVKTSPPGIMNLIS
ncbi:hypothetical protein PTKIN_Ptkin04bG0127100 [Pterospermum kingtungense]